ncbi:MAG: DUF445 domain-containing protein [SAR324 cluster bacterium]|nr:DUF445 domain-containing protein [SAR324 cluster bacterium]
MSEFWTNFWLYVSMPFISGIVGWGTNVVALKMTFYPLEFIGKPPFLGWQGIIPRKAEKMASLACDLMTSKLISIEEIFTRLDPKRVAAEMEPALLNLIETITNQIMMEQAASMWEMIPQRVKDEIYHRAKDEAPTVIATMMQEIKDNINELFDLKAMVTDSLVRDKQLLNEIFLRVGNKEFKFIEISGFYFGFAFGVIQMILWIFYKGSWQLPVCGLIVGYATNWLALKMIFEPAKPTTFGPYKILGREFGPWIIQGLFLKRQQEVAGDYGALISKEILHAENIFMGILKGPSSDKLFHLIQRHVKRSIDQYAGITKPFIALTIGTKNYINMKDSAVNHIMEHTPESLKHVHVYAEEAWDIENTLRVKMQALTPEEFVNLLRPAFQEDEWILILVGAILGMFVGFFQLFVMFS